MELTELCRPTQKVPSPRAALRDSLWEHCRNSLGIARLLIYEDRSDALVATACHSAVEAGCRAALAQAGLGYDGDVERGLQALAAPVDVRAPLAPHTKAARLASTERAIAWLAAFLRSEAPERTWGY